MTTTRASQVQVPVTLLANTGSYPDFEYSVHTVPRTHRDEVQAIFPSTPVDDMLIIPTCQKSSVDLVEWGDDAAKEKDKLLLRFQRLAKAVCERLIGEGFWADYIDPCSGLPMLHREGNTVYGEVQGMTTLLGYKTANAGCCGVLLHPRWGSSVYPASFFARAPVEVVVRVINDVERQGELLST